MSPFSPISPSFVSFSPLSIVSPPLFAYSPPLFPSAPPPHSSFSLCLPQTSGCISPPAGCMTGEQVERRANDKSLSSSLPASLSLSLSLSPSHPLSCQRPSSAFLPPSFLRAPSHRIWPHWYSNLPRLHSTFSRHEGLVKTTKGERRWANVPTLILKTQLDTSKWWSVRREWCSAALQVHEEINWSWLIKDCKTA